MSFLNFGYLIITVSKKYKNNAMNAILVNQLSYKKTELLSDGTLKIKISSQNKEKYESVFQIYGIEASFSKNMGLSSVLFRYKHRWGIILGLIFLIFSIYASSLFVWRIDISGNSSVSDEEILKILEKNNFSLGSFIPSINYDELHNRFLLDSKDISWISVNIVGNVANVYVKETMKENASDKVKYANVVAKYDGQIALIHIFNGEKTISIGDVVKKGDLLISGIIDSQSLGSRYVNANGIVKAYINKPINIKIPFNNSEKVYTGKIYTNKKIKIFSKTIKFSLNSRNYDDFCDTIEKKEKLRIFGSTELPIEISTTYYKEYEFLEKTYSHTEAVDIAFSKLREELDISLLNAELISKSVNTYFDEEYLYVDCNLYCIEDIASIVEFEIQ